MNRNEVVRYFELLKGRFPIELLSVDEFPSGAVVIDFDLGEHWFELVKSADGQFGISSGIESPIPFTGCDEVFNNWEDARLALEHKLESLAKPVAP